MQKSIYTLLLSALLFSACSDSKEQDNGNNNTDSTQTAEVTTEENTEEMEVALAFDGVQKGDYLLYGHSEIEADVAAVSLEEMNSMIAETGNFNGNVNVNIAEVCKKAGCWITFNNGEEDVRVFFRDHFTIPTETLPGTEAVLNGSVMLDTLTVDFQKHLLDDAAEAGEEVSQEEYDAITEDLIETTFDCEAILVRQTNS